MLQTRVDEPDVLAVGKHPAAPSFGQFMHQPQAFQLVVVRIRDEVTRCSERKSQRLVWPGFMTSRRTCSFNSLL